MTGYLAARNSRALMTRPRNNSMDLTVNFICYTAGPGIVSALLTRLFPGAISIPPWPFLLGGIIVWALPSFALYIVVSIFLTSHLHWHCFWRSPPPVCRPRDQFLTRRTLTGPGP